MNYERLLEQIETLSQGLSEAKDAIANVVILRKNPKHGVQVLIARNHKSDDEWALPGGRLDKGETAEEAARREIKEETGITLRQMRYLTKIMGHQSRNGRDVTTFWAVVPPSTVAVAGSDVQEVKWQGAAKIKKMKFDDHLLIQSALVKAFPSSELLKMLFQGIQNRLSESTAFQRSRPAIRTGKLIVFEGMDGSGKSTQAKELADWLKKQGHEVVVTKWNSSPLLSPSIKQGKKDQALSPMLFSLMHASDLIHRYETVILPALAAGKTVLCDRYYYTSLVRDRLRGVDENLIRQLYADMREPDLLIHCVVPIDLAIERILKEKGAFKHYSSGNDIGIDARTYTSQMNDLYGSLLPQQKGYVKVDTARSIEDSAVDIQKAVSSHI